MPLSPQHRRQLHDFPPALRAAVEAELAAGNEVAEFGCGHPSPPVGAWVRLARPMSVRARDARDGLRLLENVNWTSSRQLTDAQGFFFVLDPPDAPPPEPDMDAIREGRARGAAARTEEPARGAGTVASPGASPVPPGAAPDTASPLRRFERSMVLDYEKWHDGIGYDLDALRAADGSERDAIEAMLVTHEPRDWRDVEALAALGTDRARATLVRLAAHPDHEVRLAVARYAPEMVRDDRRAASIVSALESAELGSGLSEAIDQAAEFHPPEVVDALFRGALARRGDAAVHFAALLTFVHGKAVEPFDWEQRPFFLRFHTDEVAEREAVFRELCERIGVAADEALRRARRAR
jgi:hypothetical protein